MAGSVSTPVAKTPQQVLDEQNNGQNFNVGGSVADAATPPTTSTDTNEPPELTTARQTYSDTQTAVAGVNQQITDINNAINSALQNKRDEISRSGGIVDKVSSVPLSWLKMLHFLQKEII